MPTTTSVRISPEQVIAWCRSKQAQSFLSRRDVSGWTSGGCGLLALAAQDALGATMWGLWGEHSDDEPGACQSGESRDDMVLQHIIIEIGGVFFDGSMVLGADIESAAMAYGVAEDLLIKDWDTVLADDIDDAAILCDRVSVERISGMLARIAK